MPDRPLENNTQRPQPLRLPSNRFAMKAWRSPFMRDEGTLSCPCGPEKMLGDLVMFDPIRAVWGYPPISSLSECPLRSLSSPSLHHHAAGLGRTAAEGALHVDAVGFGQGAFFGALSPIPRSR